MFLKDVNSKITKEEMKEILDMEERTKELVNIEKENSKLYISEIIEKEKPNFKSNNLILAPTGSGKSYLIENKLIPKDFDKKIIYLTSNTALKESVCPNDSKLRKIKADNGQSVNFFTSSNKDYYGDRNYSVHVMTYHEFGKKIEFPYLRDKFLKDVELVFCDEIHSLPIYKSYNNSEVLGIATSWLLDKHDNIRKYFFTATRDKLDEIQREVPEYLAYVNMFDYLNHPDIRKYVAKSTYYITNINQIRPHLKARLESFNYNNNKALAFSRLISDQKEIEKIAREEGFEPICLWSINSEEKMSDEQIKVRDYILRTGIIPEPYNILIINGSMQEGWNLYDKRVTLAILNTVDNTEKVQALGRIRKDIDVLINKTSNSDTDGFVSLSDVYLNRPLSTDEKRAIAEDLQIRDDRDRIVKWPTIKKIAENSGYTVEDKIKRVDGKSTRFTIITVGEPEKL